MSENVFGKSPVGIDLSANNCERNNASVITTYLLAAVFVALRFYTRYRVQRTEVASDDWIILAALVRYSHADVFGDCQALIPIHSTQLAVTANLVCTIIGMSEPCLLVHEIRF